MKPFLKSKPSLLSLWKAEPFLGVFLPFATVGRASELARSRPNPSRSYKIACRPCLAIVFVSKLRRSCRRSTRDWQGLLRDESRVANPTETVLLYDPLEERSSSPPMLSSATALPLLSTQSIGVTHSMLQKSGFLIFSPDLDLVQKHGMKIPIIIVNEEQPQTSNIELLVRATILLLSLSGPSIDYDDPFVTTQSTLVKGESNLIKARSKEEFDSEKALNKDVIFRALFEENCGRIARRTIRTSQQGEKDNGMPLLKYRGLLDCMLDCLVEFENLVIVLPWQAHSRLKNNVQRVARGLRHASKGASCVGIKEQPSYLRRKACSNFGECCGEDGIVQHFDLRSNIATKLFTCHAFQETSKPRPPLPLRLNVIAIDPNYFSIGGSDEYAHVYDIRKHQWDASTNEDCPVDSFCHQHLIGNDNVNITGLDYSNQGELFVSYNDELIYLFQREMSLGPNPKLPSAEKRNELEVSGSDCGRIFIWRKKGDELVHLMVGDQHVVNCLEPHPYATILATSGIEKNVKIWAPTADHLISLPDNVDEIMEANKQGREDRSHITLTPDVIMRVLRLQRQQSQRTA
eukprot:Gb_09135 [translate_table: standard]